MSTDVSRKRKGKDYLEDIGIDKRILLEGSVKKQCVSCVCVCVCVCEAVDCTRGKRKPPCSRNGRIYKSKSVNRISFYYYLQMYTCNPTYKHVILPKDLS